ncbi:hypothetical protein Droror1_Dr00014269 [Drosera rotundifolia]
MIFAPSTHNPNPNRFSNPSLGFATRGELRDGYCLILIGNDAKRMNLVSEDLMLGFDNGPRSNEKRMSLNVQSQVMKKEVRPVRREEESGSGRMKKRVMNGRWAMRLGMPLGIFEVMKKMKVRDVRTEVMILSSVIASFGGFILVCVCGNLGGFFFLSCANLGGFLYVGKAV